MRSKPQSRHLEYIAANMRRQRLARGWTQTQLGREAGLPRATIAQIEVCRHRTITLETLIPITRALGTSVDALLMPLEPIAA